MAFHKLGTERIMDTIATPSMPKLREPKLGSYQLGPRFRTIAGSSQYLDCSMDPVKNLLNLL